MKTLTRTFSARPMRLAAATLLLAIAGSIALTAEAAPRGGPGGPSMMMMLGSPQHVDRLLDAVDASTEQRSQVKSIMGAAQADLKAQREAGRSLREQTMQLFTQPTVDARAAEALRQQMLAQHDQASKRMLQAMLDVSRVLTPEQRSQLAAGIAAGRAAMERHRAEHTPTR